MLLGWLLSKRSKLSAQSGAKGIKNTGKPRIARLEHDQSHKRDHLIAVAVKRNC